MTAGIVLACVALAILLIAFGFAMLAPSADGAGLAFFFFGTIIASIVLILAVLFFIFSLSGCEVRLHTPIEFKETK